MTRPYTIETLIELAEGDSVFIEDLFHFGILERGRKITRDDLERTRLACSLVKELEVNLAGAQIIIQMREQLLATRAQLLELTEITSQLVQKTESKSE